MSSCLPNPRLGPPARERERTPARLARLGRGHRAGGVTPVEQATGPAVKTSSPRLPPRDAERAVGGIRAWGENPGRRASSLTTVLRFGCSCVPEPQKVSRGPSPQPSADSLPAPPAATDHTRTGPLRAAKRALGSECAPASFRRWTTVARVEHRLAYGPAVGAGDRDPCATRPQQVGSNSAGRDFAGRVRCEE
jgi:hypothetical protein